MGRGEARKKKRPTLVSRVHTPIPSQAHPARQTAPIRAYQAHQVSCDFRSEGTAGQRSITQGRAHRGHRPPAIARTPDMPTCM